MTDKTDKKRDAPISIRIPADRLDEFRHNVAESGLPTNAYVVRALFNLPVPRGTRRPAVEKQMLARLLGRASAIQDALDSATRIAGEDVRMLAAIEAARDELSLIRAAALKMMEREP